MKGDTADISVAEPFKEPKLCMSVKGFRVDTSQGSIGMGTNKQKAVFGNIRIEPIRLKKPEPSTQSDLKLDIDLENDSASIDAPEVKPVDVVENPSISPVALGRNGGMAPKKQQISQEAALEISDVVKNSSVDERNNFCRKHFETDVQRNACLED